MRSFLFDKPALADMQSAGEEKMKTGGTTVDVDIVPDYVAHQKSTVKQNRCMTLQPISAADLQELHVQEK